MLTIASSCSSTDSVPKRMDRLEVNLCSGGKLRKERGGLVTAGLAQDGGPHWLGVRVGGMTEKGTLL